MKRRYVFGGLALVAVLAIAAPALGGPSLKKLVKKEVAKQISKATGPAGAPGAAGAAGTARAFGYVDKFFCDNPGPCTATDPKKGVASVTHQGGGKYCVSVPGLSPETAPATVSVALDESFPGNASNAVGYSELGSMSCPFPNYQFQTFDPADPTANVDTSFTFVIP
jgi:hypothetical protein